MVRILHAPRWALAAVVGTFVVAVAVLVTGLSAAASPGNGAPPQVAASAGDNNGRDGDNHDGDNHDGDKHDGDNKTKTKTETSTTATTKTKTETTATTKTETTATTKTSTATTATTETTAPTTTATELPVTGSSSTSPLILIGSAMLLAGGIGTVALRRWRDAADRRG